MPPSEKRSPLTVLGYQRAVLEASADATSAHNRAGDFEDLLQLDTRGVVNLSPTVAVDRYSRPREVWVDSGMTAVCWSADQMGERLPANPGLMRDLLGLAVRVQDHAVAVKRFVLRHGSIAFPWRESPWEGSPDVEVLPVETEGDPNRIVVRGAVDPSLRRQFVAEYVEVAEVVFSTLKLFLAHPGPSTPAGGSASGLSMRTEDFQVLTRFLSKRIRRRPGVIAKLLWDERLARAVANRTKLTPEDWAASRLAWCSAVFDLFASNPGHGGFPLTPVLRQQEPGHLAQTWTGGAINVLAMSLMAIFTESPHLLTCTFCRRLYGARRRAKRSAKASCCSNPDCVKARRRLSMWQSRTRNTADDDTATGGRES